MLRYNFILNLFNLKDENITFNENSYSEEVINGIRAQVYCGTLTCNPYRCEFCGCIYGDRIQCEKHDFITSFI